MELTVQTRKRRSDAWDAEGMKFLYSINVRSNLLVIGRQTIRVEEGQP